MKLSIQDSLVSHLHTLRRGKGLVARSCETASNQIRLRGGTSISPANADTVELRAFSKPYHILEEFADTGVQRLIEKSVHGWVQMKRGKPDLLFWCLVVVESEGRRPRATTYEHLRISLVRNSKKLKEGSTDLLPLAWDVLQPS